MDNVRQQAACLDGRSPESEAHPQTKAGRSTTFKPQPDSCLTQDEKVDVSPSEATGLEPRSAI